MAQHHTNTDAPHQTSQFSSHSDESGCYPPRSLQCYLHVLTHKQVLVATSGASVPKVGLSSQ